MPQLWLQATDAGQDCSHWAFAAQETDPDLHQGPAGLAHQGSDRSAPSRSTSAPQTRRPVEAERDPRSVRPLGSACPAPCGPHNGRPARRGLHPSRSGRTPQPHTQEHPPPAHTAAKGSPTTSALQGNGATGATSRHSPDFRFRRASAGAGLSGLAIITGSACGVFPVAASTVRLADSPRRLVGGAIPCVRSPPARPGQDTTLLSSRRPSDLEAKHTSRRPWGIMAAKDSYFQRP
ncbi:uncharacterized protein LOC130541958 [Ursus arctos]|uniref:uncharacterized protein LOC130541958 n=1 Tax=Ursus arctos TaxID=9644 RepID=UPI001CF8DE83|nr:uncharacterized protein LOC130541958 [Ursus arctos]